MAFTNFTPGARVVLSDDGRSFRIYDDSIWNGKSGNVTAAAIHVKHIDDNENEIDYDPYPLIRYNDDSPFQQYLSSDGCLVNMSDMRINGNVVSERFPDGYYEVKITFTDGSYQTGKEPYFTAVLAFLAKYRCMKRSMPALLLDWPITDEIRRKNEDIYSLSLYLDAAEYAASLEQMTKFRRFIAVIRNIFDHYDIPQPW